MRRFMRRVSKKGREDDGSGAPKASTLSKSASSGRRTPSSSSRSSSKVASRASSSTSSPTGVKRGLSARSASSPRSARTTTSTTASAAASAARDEADDAAEEAEQKGGDVFSGSSSFPAAASSSNTSDNVVVAVRMRPRRKGDFGTYGWDICDRYSVQETAKDGKGGTHFFERVFGPRATTEEVYNEIARPIVRSVMEGFNGTIFAYGQTASGKTHTILGAGNGSNEPGVIPLAIRQIFETIESRPEYLFLLRVSYLEIYNEQLRDLLADPKKGSASSGAPSGGAAFAQPSSSASPNRLQLRQAAEDTVVVSGLSEHIVTSPEEVAVALRRGSENRTVGVNDLNAHSSRSHTIFRLIMESTIRTSHENDEQAAGDTKRGSLVKKKGSKGRAKKGGSKGKLSGGGSSRGLSVATSGVGGANGGPSDEPPSPVSVSVSYLGRLNSDGGPNGGDSGGGGGGGGSNQNMVTEKLRGAVIVSELNLVDLAGSETLSYNFSESQQKETKAINLSLTQLKTVITALSQGKKHVPFRNSLLTRILKNSLGGNAKTAAICAVSPAPEHQKMTRSTLYFGSLAKNIKNRARINEYADDDRKVMLKQYKKRIDQLEAKLNGYRELEAAKAKIQSDYLMLQRQISELQRRENERKELQGEVRAIGKVVMYGSMKKGAAADGAAAGLTPEAVAEMNGQMAKLQEENTVLTEQLARQHQEKVRAESEIREKQQALAEERKRADERERELANLQEQRQEVKIIEQRHQARMEQLEQEIAASGIDRDSYLAQLIDDYERKMYRSERKLNEQLGLKEAEKLALAQEIDRLRKRVNKQSDELRKLKAERKKMKAREREAGAKAEDEDEDENDKIGDNGGGGGGGKQKKLAEDDDDGENEAFVGELVRREMQALKEHYRDQSEQQQNEIQRLKEELAKAILER